MNGQNFIQNGEIYVGAGSTVAVEALPNPGFVFGGWGPVPVAGGESQAFINSYIVNQPIIIRPGFGFAAGIGFHRDHASGLADPGRPYTHDLARGPRVGAPSWPVQACASGRICRSGQTQVHTG